MNLVRPPFRGAEPDVRWLRYPPMVPVDFPREIPERTQSHHSLDFLESSTVGHSMQKFDTFWKIA